MNAHNSIVFEAANSTALFYLRDSGHAWLVASEVANQFASPDCSGKPVLNEKAWARAAARYKCLMYFRAQKAKCRSFDLLGEGDVQTEDRSRDTAFRSAVRNSDTRKLVRLVFEVLEYLEPNHSRRAMFVRACRRESTMKVFAASNGMTELQANNYVAKLRTKLSEEFYRRLSEDQRQDLKDSEVRILAGSQSAKSSKKHHLQ
jgi:hypothetical protein